MRQRGFAHLLPLIIVLILAFSSAYYFLFYGRVWAEDKSTPQAVTETTVALDAPTPSPTPISTTEQTEHGTVYTNNIFGYEVTIPATWSLEENSPGGATFVPLSEQKKESYRTVVTITISDQPTKYPLATDEEYIEWKAKPVSGGHGQRLFKRANTAVGGYNAVQFVTRVLPGDPTEAYYGVTSWFRKDGKNYYLELGGDYLRSVENMGAYNKILSSFKFNQLSVDI